MILPLPFIRSMGIGGMLIPAVSVIAAITLLPALLAVLGQRINSVRVMPKRFVDSGHPEDGAWGSWARLVLRRPVPVAVVGIVIVAVLVGIGLQLNPNESQLKNFPGSGTAIAGRQLLANAGISPGVMKPFDVLVENGGDAQRNREEGGRRRRCRGRNPPGRLAARPGLARRGIPRHRRRRTGDPGNRRPGQRFAARHERHARRDLGDRPRLRTRGLRELPVRARVRA